MPTSLFPVLALDVFKIGPRRRPDGRRAAARRVPRGPPVRLGRVGPADRAARSSWPSSGWGLAITAFGLVTFSFPLALALPGVSPVRPTSFGGLPVHARPARDAGRAARAGHVDPHARRDQRPAPGRHRGGRRRGADRARSSQSSRAAFSCLVGVRRGRATLPGAQGLHATSAPSGGLGVDRWLPGAATE